MLCCLYKCQHFQMFFCFFFSFLDVLSYWHRTLAQWKQLLQICHSGPSLTCVMCQHWRQKLSILISDYTPRHEWWTVFPLIVTHLLIITIWCDLSPFSNAGPSFVQMFKKVAALCLFSSGSFEAYVGSLAALLFKMFQSKEDCSSQRHNNLIAKCSPSAGLLVSGHLR